MLGNSNYKEGGVPTRLIFESPTKSNHRQTPGALKSPQQGLLTTIGSAGLGNSDAKHSLSRLNSPCPSLGKRVLCPTTR